MQTLPGLGMVMKFFKIFLFLVHAYGCVLSACERGENVVVDPSRTGMIGDCEAPNPGKSYAPLGTAMAVSLQPC